MANTGSGDQRWNPRPTLDEDQSFIVESGTPSFTQRLTRRQKLRRGVVSMLVVVAAAFVLLGGPGAASSLIIGLHEQAAAAPVPTARVASITSVRLPPGSATIATLRISPAASGGGAYACWVTPSVANAAAEALHVAILDGASDLDGAAESWRPVDPPASNAVRCGIAADTISPRKALFSVYDRTGSGASCSLPHLYFTDDGGATWKPVYWPGLSQAVCSLHLELVAGHIYAASPGWQLARGGRTASATVHLIISSNLGHSWQIGDAGLIGAADFQLVGIRQGGDLLAQTSDQSQPSISTLWESHDDGTSWISLGRLPGANAQVYASQNPADTAHGGWGKLYLSAETLTNGVAGGPGHMFFATAYLRSGWSVLAGLPTPPGDTSPEPIDTTDTGVGPNGLFYVVRSMTSSNGRAFVPQRSLWIWDMRHRRWLMSAVGIPENALLQGMSWSGPTMRLWMTIIHQGIPPAVQITALTLTSQSGT